MRASSNADVLTVSVTPVVMVDGCGSANVVEPDGNDVDVDVVAIEPFRQLANRDRRGGPGRIERNEAAAEAEEVEQHELISRAVGVDAVEQVTNADVGHASLTAG